MPLIGRLVSKLGSNLICLPRYIGALCRMPPAVRPELDLKPFSDSKWLGSDRHFCLYICWMKELDAVSFSWESPFMPKSSGSFLLTSYVLILQSFEGGTLIISNCSYGCFHHQQFELFLFKSNFSICFLTTAILETILDWFWWLTCDSFFLSLCGTLCQALGSLPFSPERLWGKISASRL